MSDMTALERRYRRLLGWYPAAHRGTYGEEMIGVLLASTPAEQDRPSKADTLDLIGGGLRTRLRRLRDGEGSPAWRDALAVFSVVAPVILLGWLTAGYLAELARQAEHPFLLRDQAISRADATLLTALIATAVVVAALATCPALTRRGRTRAAAAVGVIAAAAAVVGLVKVYRGFGVFDDEFTLYLSATAAMEVLALIASPGPARGWQLLSRRGLIVLAVISVVVIAASTAGGTTNWWYVNSISAISGIVTVLGVALTLRRPVGGRLIALWAIPGYQFIGFAVAEYLFTSLQFGSWVAFELEFRLLPTVVVAVLVGLAAWRSGRRDADRRHSI